MPKISRRGSLTASTPGSRDMRGVLYPQSGGSSHSPHDLEDPPGFHLLDEIQEVRDVDRVLDFSAAADLGHGGGVLGRERQVPGEATFGLRQLHHLCSRAKA